MISLRPLFIFIFQAEEYGLLLIERNCTQWYRRHWQNHHLLWCQLPILCQLWKSTQSFPRLSPVSYRQNHIFWYQCIPHLRPYPPLFSMPCPAFHTVSGAGVIDGEVLETLWLTLNQVSPSAQVASLPSRSEMLDDHMLNSNWNKLLNIGKVLDCPTCLAN